MPSRTAALPSSQGRNDCNRALAPEHQPGCFARRNWKGGREPPRVFRGPKLPIEWRCRRYWRGPSERRRGWPIRNGLRQAIAQFRRRTLAVVERRMLRHLVSHATRKLLLRLAVFLLLAFHAVAEEEEGGNCCNLHTGGKQLCSNHYAQTREEAENARQRSFGVLVLAVLKLSGQSDRSRRPR